jgi:hypothetical protein
MPGTPASVCPKWTPCGPRRQTERVAFRFSDALGDLVPRFRPVEQLFGPAGVDTAGAGGDRVELLDAKG